MMPRNVRWSLSVVVLGLALEACAHGNGTSSGAAVAATGAGGQKQQDERPLVKDGQLSAQAASQLAEAVKVAKEGQLQESLNRFERLYNSDHVPLAAFDAGVIYERLGQPDRAEAWYEKAMATQADFAPANENLTRLRLRTARAAQAEQSLKSKLERSPDSLGLRNSLTEVYIATGRLDEAEQEAKKVLKADERNIPAMLNLASLYYAKKRYELAKMVLENARQVDKQNPAILNKLSFTERSLGNVPGAYELIKQAAALRDDYPEAHLNYGAMLNEAEDYPAAIKELELAAQYAPSDAQVQLNLGNAYRGAKEFDKAQSAYERALNLDPKLIDATYNLGVLYIDGEKPELPTLQRLDKGLAYLTQFQKEGGQDPKLDQIKKDVGVAVEKEKKRLAREDRDKLRKAADAKKKAEAVPLETPPTSTNTKGGTQVNP